jgi:thioredoxin reductase (NADPH)
LNDWDLSLAFERKQILVNPATFEILAPQGVESSGLYAIGDINAYPGKRRLILSSFHEATLAAYHMAERHAATPVPTLYTTSSRVLQERLKINSKH